MATLPKSKLTLSLLLLLVVGSLGGAQKRKPKDIVYTPKPQPTMKVGIPGLVEFKSIVNETTLGSSELEVAMITQEAKPAPKPGDKIMYHEHKSVEVFYILEGVLVDTFENDPENPYRYEAGDIAIVRPNDRVNHRAEVRVKGIAIWGPGGELERFTSSDPPWKKEKLPAEIRKRTAYDSR